ELGRLAEAVGAAELLEGVEDGGETRAVALRALPLADDGELALGRLGDLARGAAGAERTAILEAILGVAGRPRTERELIDPEGVRACGRALVAIASDVAIERGDRALAISAARGLAEKGYLDRARIPTDLDPK